MKESDQEETLFYSALSGITQYLQNTVNTSSPLTIPILCATSASLRRAAENTFDELQLTYNTLETKLIANRTQLRRYRRLHDPYEEQQELYGWNSFILLTYSIVSFDEFLLSRWWLRKRVEMCNNDVNNINRAKQHERNAALEFLQSFPAFPRNVCRAERRYRQYQDAYMTTCRLCLRYNGEAAVFIDNTCNGKNNEIRENDTNIHCNSCNKGENTDAAESNLENVTHTQEMSSATSQCIDMSTDNNINNSNNGSVNSINTKVNKNINAQEMNKVDNASDTCRSCSNDEIVSSTLLKDADAITNLQMVEKTNYTVLTNEESKMSESLQVISVAVPSLGALLSVEFIAQVEITNASLALTPMHYFHYLTTPVGLQTLIIRNSHIPLHELINVMLSNVQTLNKLHLSQMHIPLLNTAALCPRLRMLEVKNICIRHEPVIVNVDEDVRRENIDVAKVQECLMALPLSSLNNLACLCELHIVNVNEAIPLERLHTCNALRTINLNGSTINDTHIAHIGLITRLESLSVSRTQITSLEPLCACVSLRSIQASRTLITSRGIAGLEHLPHLEQLDLSYSLITHVNMLAASKSLRMINLVSTCVSAKGIAGLEKITVLRNLCVGKNKLEDANTLASAHHLRQLFLEETFIDEEGIKEFYQLTQLEVLVLRWNPVRDVAILSWCVKLKKLDLKGSLVDTAGIQTLHTLPLLSTLILSHTLVDDISSLSSSPSLRVIEIKKGNIVHGMGVKGVGDIATLHSLTLTECGLDNLDMLGECNCLRQLNMWACNLSSDGIRQLSRATHLEFVDLANTPVDDITTLLHCTNIRTLILNGTFIKTIDGIAALHLLERLEIAQTAVNSVSELRFCTRLVHLNISETMIDDDGFRGVESLPLLEVVFMSKTHITCVGQLGECTQLHTLYAPWCLITSFGLQGIERARKLIKLNLAYTSVDDSHNAVHVLSKLHHLRKLNVNFTHLSENAIRHLIQHLPLCKISQTCMSRAPVIVLQHASHEMLEKR